MTNEFVLYFGIDALEIINPHLNNLLRGEGYISFEERLSKFYTFILNGDEEKLFSLFSGIPRIDIPVEGKINGREAFSKFVACQKTWLKKA